MFQRQLHRTTSSHPRPPVYCLQRLPIPPLPLPGHHRLPRALSILPPTICLHLYSFTVPLTKTFVPPQTSMSQITMRLIRPNDPSDLLATRQIMVYKGCHVCWTVIDPGIYFAADLCWGQFCNTAKSAYKWNKRLSKKRETYDLQLNLGAWVPDLEEGGWPSRESQRVRAKGHLAQSWHLKSQYAESKTKRERACPTESYNNFITARLPVPDSSKSYSILLWAYLSSTTLLIQRSI